MLLMAVNSGGVTVAKKILANVDSDAFKREYELFKRNNYRNACLFLSERELNEALNAITTQKLGGQTYL